MAKIKTTKALRFAPLIRVSTERQEQKGQSLDSQRKAIKRAVKRMGGSIPESCWKYSGKEHATEGSERKKLDALLSDSYKNIFDAIIMSEDDRWARDSLKSEQGISILKENRIRYFLLEREQNLFEPAEALPIKMGVAYAEYYALSLLKRSMNSRIDRARDTNAPTGGSLPYGRIWNKDSKKWSIDPEKKALIKTVAKRYLAGESCEKLSMECGMNPKALWKILSKRTGDTWEQSFRCKRLNIDETIPTKIPPLLDKKTIASIQKQLTANRTYDSGRKKTYKNKFLLGSFVFCKTCGYTLSGGKTYHGKPYYRHFKKGIKPCSETWHTVQAESLDRAVMAHVFGMLGDQVVLKKAIEDSNPGCNKADELRERLTHIDKDLAKIVRRKDKVVEAIANEIISDADAKKQNSKYNEQISHLESKKSTIQDQLSNIPDAKKVSKEVARRRQAFKKLSAGRHSKSAKRFKKMTFEDERDLLKLVLGGSDSSGKRYGVYVSKSPDGQFCFEIRGTLDQVISQNLPMDKLLAQELVGVEFDFDDYDPLSKTVVGDESKKQKKSGSKKKKAVNKASGGHGINTSPSIP